MPENTLPRDDMRATIEARRDLGPDYESALVEGFLDKVDDAIATRIDAALTARMGPPPPPQAHYPPYPPPPAPPKGRHAHVWLALGTMTLGIPLGAIGAGTAGFAGFLLVLVAIVAVNVVAGLHTR
ncbi:hypothetical protein [Spongiactinospora sp. TRM90649]|uniref:hypothetical protein n=1 Tax=Spongiactinospora sp. TRM90649 TaxID=3031114 RepID=UPI0023F98A3D|nr:hypothetical protein [Spongiactinospora sp. TRM90649]MDF5757156.1 hypothetical protein [Spongiactinospora sp. TRM90649]